MDKEAVEALAAVLRLPANELVAAHTAAGVKLIFACMGTLIALVAFMYSLYFAIRGAKKAIHEDSDYILPWFVGAMALCAFCLLVGSQLFREFGELVFWLSKPEAYGITELVKALSS